MIEICIKKTPDVSAEMRAQINQLTLEVFEFDTLFDFLHEAGIHVLALAENQKLLGHAVITERTFVTDGMTMRAAYVDSVMVRPELRGQQLGRMVMQQVVETADEYGFDIAGLATFIPKFYAKFGWELWTGPLALDKDGEIIETPDEKGMMIHRLKATPEKVDTKSRLIASWRPHQPW